MLINLRNALMADKRLPYDAEVEYLESTGMQWIDTGVSLFNPDVADWRIVITFSYDTSYNYNAIFATTSGTTNYESWIAADDAFVVRIANYRMPVRTLSRNSQYCTEVSNTTAEGCSIKIDGVSEYTHAYFQPPSGTQGTITVGHRPRPAGGSAGGYLKGRIYSVKLFIGSTLVYDAIPVRKGAVGYLYDRVTGKLFGNAGTGDFVVGQDVVPVEYIESHGTEWIDTGVAFADNFRWSVDFDGLDVQKTIFGGRASTTRTSLLYRYSASEVVINIAQYASTTTPFKLGNIASGRHCVECAINQNVGNVWLDGVQVYTNEAIAGTYISGVSQALFADNFGSYVLEQASSKLYKCQMWQSGTLVRSFLPVRVGTEGAAMDVPTRRIYRNAGTGAFGYGNDLKYPIPA